VIQANATSVPQAPEPVNKDTVKVYVLWGLKSATEATGMDPSVVSDFKVIYDESFDLSQPAAQLGMIDFCTQVTTAQVKARLHIQLTRCVMEAFKSWLLQQSMSFPVPSSQFAARFRLFMATDTYRRNYNNDVYFAADSSKPLWMRNIYQTDIGKNLGSFDLEVATPLSTTCCLPALPCLAVLPSAGFLTLCGVPLPDCLSCLFLFCSLSFTHGKTTS